MYSKLLVNCFIITAKSFAVHDLNCPQSFLEILMQSYIIGTKLKTHFNVKFTCELQISQEFPLNVLTFSWSKKSFSFS